MGARARSAASRMLSACELARVPAGPRLRVQRAECVDGVGARRRLMGEASEVGAALMRMAIDWAREAVGLTSENPAVGCCPARGSIVPAIARTATGGRPHAEERALALAGPPARGATAYVTLEPCGWRTSGATSCAELLVRAAGTRRRRCGRSLTGKSGAAPPSRGRDARRGRADRDLGRGAAKRSSNAAGVRLARRVVSVRGDGSCVSSDLRGQRSRGRTLGRISGEHGPHGVPTAAAVTGWSNIGAGPEPDVHDGRSPSRSVHGGGGAAGSPGISGRIGSIPAAAATPWRLWWRPAGESSGG